MIPPQIQGWLLLPQGEIEKSGHCWSSLNIKLVETSLLDLFTDDVFQSVDRPHGKDSGNPRKQHAYDAVEEIPEDDDDTRLRNSTKHSLAIARHETS